MMERTLPKMSARLEKNLSDGLPDHNATIAVGASDADALRVDEIGDDVGRQLVVASDLADGEDEVGQGGLAISVPVSIRAEGLHGLPK